MTSKYVTSFDGTRIFYIHAKGKLNHTLVFLHGVGGNWTTWEKEMDYFHDKGYSVLAMDLRGHGKSDIPTDFKSYQFMNFCADVHHVIKDAKLKDFSIIGHSVGTGIGTMYCSRYKKKSPSSVVIIEGGIKYPYPHNSPFDVNPYVTHLLRFLSQHESVKKEHLPHFHEEIDLSKKSSVKKHMSLILHLLHISPLIGIINTLDNVEKYIFNNQKKIKSTIHNLTIPVLAIAGGKDYIIPPKDVKIIKELNNQTEFHIIPQATHSAVMDSPLKISKLIDNFLTKNKIVQ